MKKLIAALFAATLVGGGLVGVISAPAHAVCDGYAPCPNTRAAVDGPSTVPVDGRATICVTVRSADRRPQGTVRLAVERTRGGYSFSDSKAYDGQTCFRTDRLPRAGKYEATATFVGDNFKNDRDSMTFRVKRR